MREGGIDAADDEGGLTVVADAGIHGQSLAGRRAAFERCDRFGKPAQAEAGSSQGAVGEAPRLRGRMIDREIAQPVGDQLGILQVGTVVDAVPEPPKSQEELLLVAGTLCELDDPSIVRLDFGRGVSVQRDARYADHRQCTQFEGGALGSLGQPSDQPKGPLKVVDRFLIGIARVGVAPGEQ